MSSFSITKIISININLNLYNIILYYIILYYIILYYIIYYIISFTYDTNLELLITLPPAF